VITLYQFPSHLGLPNASPFCMKVETYLRMVELTYEIRSVMDPRKSPKGKFPYIKCDGQSIADSEFIIQFLKDKFGDSLDKNLTTEQKALATLLENTFSERINWFIVYTRWQDDAGWEHTKKGFFSKLPALAKLFVPNMVRKKTLNALHLQGIGRHSQVEMLQLACKSLDAIAVILGDKNYFLGSEPTTVDASAFSSLANILGSPYETPLKTYLQKYPNIQAYCVRMWRNFYPEMKMPLGFNM